MKVVNRLTDAIGNTPVVRLRNVVPKGAAHVLVKVEGVNPTGSYKDRMALAMIEEAEKRGDLRPGMTVIEYTGGSTGSSLAFVCAAKGYNFFVVSSDAFALEKLKTMQAFGAKLEIIESDNGQITRDLILQLIERTKDLAARDDFYATDQFNNSDSLIGYSNIGYELMDQVEDPIDVFCGGVGTAGMAMGVATAFKNAKRDTKVIVFEPASSAVISMGQPGQHRVEGVGVGFVPPLLDKSLFSEVRTVEESEARKMAQRLAKEEGIFAGISSGLNVVGAVQLATELGEGHTVATVACDSGMKYLSGDLFDL